MYDRQDISKAYQNGKIAGFNLGLGIGMVLIVFILAVWGATKL